MAIQFYTNTQGNVDIPNRLKMSYDGVTRLMTAGSILPDLFKHQTVSQNGKVAIERLISFGLARGTVGNTSTDIYTGSGSRSPHDFPTIFNLKGGYASVDYSMLEENAYSTPEGQYYNAVDEIEQGIGQHLEWKESINLLSGNKSVIDKINTANGATYMGKISNKNADFFKNGRDGRQIYSAFRGGVDGTIAARYDITNQEIHLWQVKVNYPARFQIGATIDFVHPGTLKSLTADMPANAVDRGADNVLPFPFVYDIAASDDTIIVGYEITPSETVGQPIFPIPGVLITLADSTVKPTSGATTEYIGTGRAGIEELLNKVETNGNVDEFNDADYNYVHGVFKNQNRRWNPQYVLQPSVGTAPNIRQEYLSDDTLKKMRRLFSQNNLFVNPFVTNYASNFITDNIEGGANMYGLSNYTDLAYTSEGIVEGYRKRYLKENGISATSVNQSYMNIDAGKGEITFENQRFMVEPFAHNDRIYFLRPSQFTMHSGAMYYINQGGVVDLLLNVPSGAQIKRRTLLYFNEMTVDLPQNHGVISNVADLYRNPYVITTAGGNSAFQASLTPQESKGKKGE